MWTNYSYMRRRSVLKGAGNALLIGSSGCTGRTVGGSANSTTPTTPKSGMSRSIEITGQDSIPTEVNADLAVEVVEPTVTSDYTAVVRITFTNTGKKRDFTFGALPPFTVKESVERNPGVLLLDPEEDYQKPRPDCWRPPESSHAASYNAVAKIITLGKEESIERAVELWGSPANAEQNICLPTGEFRFERDYQFGFLDVPSFTWGFTVSLSSP